MGSCPRRISIYAAEISFKTKIAKIVAEIAFKPADVFTSPNGLPV